MDPGVGPIPQDPLHDPQTVEWERTYALFLHLSLIVAHVLVPVVPALVLWLIKREQSPFINDHGKEALNFQISLLIYYIAGACLVPVCGIGMVLIIAVFGLGMVGMVLASIAASKSRYYRYPATLRLVK